MIKKATTLKKHLEKVFPGIQCWEDGKSMLYVSAEDGTEVDGLPLADYYEYPHFDPEEKRHENGVHRKFRDFVKKNGWWIEWQNPGCLCLTN